jgi:hypothetical protein
MLCSGFSACDKNQDLLSEQSGAWELTSAEQVEMVNNAEVSRKTFNNPGYVLLTNNNSTLGYLNTCEYSFDTAFLSRGIAYLSNNTGLDRFHAICYWEAGPAIGNRLSLIKEQPGLYTPVSLVFTVNKISANKQEWYYIETRTESNGDDFFFKETFYVTRKNG